MFKVITRDKKTGKFGVLDTNDFVVEFFEFADLKNYIQRGVQIQGISYDTSTKVWDVNIQRPVIPQLLVEKICKVSKMFDFGEDDARDFLLSYTGMLQEQGENLIKFAKGSTVESLHELVALQFGW